MYYNVGSLIFGIIALICPFIGLLAEKKKNISYFLSNLSLSACLISVFFQICEYNERVNKEDWSALLDTSSFMVKIVGLLIVITVILNIVLYIKSKKTV